MHCISWVPERSYPPAHNASANALWCLDQARHQRFDMARRIPGLVLIGAGLTMPFLPWVLLSLGLVNDGRPFQFFRLWVTPAGLVCMLFGSVALVVDRFRSPPRRDSAMRRLWARWGLSPWHSEALFIAFGVCLLALPSVIIDLGFGNRAFGWFSIAIWVWPPGVYCAVFGVAVGIASFIGRSSQEVGCKFCTGCGHQIQGLLGSRCPDCGSPVDSEQGNGTNGESTACGGENGELALLADLSVKPARLGAKTFLLCSLVLGWGLSYCALTFTGRGGFGGGWLLPLDVSFAPALLIIEVWGHWYLRDWVSYLLPAQYLLYGVILVIARPRAWGGATLVLLFVGHYLCIAFVLAGPYRYSNAFARFDIAWSHVPGAVAVWAASFVLAFVGAMWFMLGPDARRLRLGRGLCCRKCGYLLHGLTEPRCPECGTAFDPGKSRATDERQGR